jgi:hypothetical protein
VVTSADPVPLQATPTPRELERASRSPILPREPRAAGRATYLAGAEPDLAERLDLALEEQLVADVGDSGGYIVNVRAELL